MKSWRAGYSDCFSKKLGDFHRLQRKALRVIVYRGTGRTHTLREQEATRGLAAGFENMLGFVNGLLPENEIIGQALRKSVPLFPELAIRELVANAIIHQDFSVTGNGPMVEIFDDRIEITNPGKPLLDPDRFPINRCAITVAHRVWLKLLNKQLHGLTDGVACHLGDDPAVCGKAMQNYFVAIFQ